MRRLAAAALLLFLGTGVASANPGPCTFGYGCGGYCFRIFPHIHQHGPLYNYGPYYGYPPFEPYGYWNAYLQYTGPIGGQNCGHGGCGHNWHFWGNHAWGSHCNHCGHGIFDGSLLHGGLGSGHIRQEHQPKTCHNCGSVAAAEIESRPAIERFNGVGDPILAAAYYVNTPSLTDPEAVMPAFLLGR